MKAARTIAIVAFSLTIAALLTALISDFTIFFEAIGTFFIGCFLSALAFMFLFMAFLASIILVFGAFLIGDYGFWPLNLSLQFFSEILGDITMSQKSIAVFRAIRIGILIACILAFLLAFISSRMKKSARKKGFSGPSGAITTFNSLTIVLSLFGIGAAALLLALLAS